MVISVLDAAPTIGAAQGAGSHPRQIRAQFLAEAICVPEPAERRSHPPAAADNPPPTPAATGERVVIRPREWAGGPGRGCHHRPPCGLLPAIRAARCHPPRHVELLEAQPNRQDRQKVPRGVSARDGGLFNRRDVCLAQAGW